MTVRGWHLFTSSLTSKALVAFPNCRTKYKKLTFFCLGLFSLIFLIIWLSCKILSNYKSSFPFHTFNLLRNASWCIYLLKNRTVGDVWLSLLTRRIVFLCFLLSVFQFPCWRVVITFFNFLFWHHKMRNELINNSNTDNYLFYQLYLSVELNSFISMFIIPSY